MNSFALTDWVTCPQPNPRSRLRLFCLPYAGGGAGVFRGWAAALPEWEVCPIQLPGRETRLKEPPFTRLSHLIPVLADQIAPYLDRPFACFGHSLGGLIAFELLHYLRDRGHRPAVHLWVSGCRAPQLPSQPPVMHTLPDAEFLQELSRFNGTPENVLANAELMALLLPTLRADFALIETYEYRSRLPLPCPITAFGGSTDREVPPADLEAWQSHTQAAFACHLLPGDHFFLNTDRETLLRYLTAAVINAL
jgi:medium-chain acyl-[acyl-carrier-protein] hydrolase